MNRTKSYGWIFILALSFLLILPTMTAYATDKVYHVPIEEEVEKGLYAFLQRAFNEAIDNHADAIVLEIHTPGGFVDAATDIGKLID